MSDRPDGRVSLLGGDRGAERSAPEGGSIHSSFHELSPPQENFDTERARSICAQITRDLLADFAPAMTLLDPAGRRRAQALTAYARTLLDFAGDATLEGERLSQINRWQFALEQALSGEPPGQPVFVVLAEVERERPWPKNALDELAAVARSRISGGQPASTEAFAATSRRLAAGVYEAMVGASCAPDTAALGEGLIRLHSLLGWRDRLFHDRRDLELTADGKGFGEATTRECAAVRELLDPVPHTRGLERQLARIVHHARLTGLALVDAIAGDPQAADPPQIGALRRLRLLMAARVRARRRPSTPLESRG